MAVTHKQATKFAYKRNSRSRVTGAYNLTGGASATSPTPAPGAISAAERAKAERKADRAAEAKARAAPVVPNAVVPNAPVTFAAPASGMVAAAPVTAKLPKAAPAKKAAKGILTVGPGVPPVPPAPVDLSAPFDAPSVAGPVRDFPTELGDRARADAMANARNYRRADSLAAVTKDVAGVGPRLGQKIDLDVKKPSLKPQSQMTKQERDIVAFAQSGKLPDEVEQGKFGRELGGAKAQVQKMLLNSALGLVGQSTAEYNTEYERKLAWENIQKIGMVQAGGEKERLLSLGRAAAVQRALGYEHNADEADYFDQAARQNAKLSLLGGLIPAAVSMIDLYNRGDELRESARTAPPPPDMVAGAMQKDTVNRMYGRYVRGGSFLVPNDTEVAKYERNAVWGAGQTLDYSPSFQDDQRAPADASSPSSMSYAERQAQWDAEALTKSTSRQAQWDAESLAKELAYTTEAARKAEMAPLYDAYYALDKINKDAAKYPDKIVMGELPEVARARGDIEAWDTSIRRYGALKPDLQAKYDAAQALIAARGGQGQSTIVPGWNSEARAAERQAALDVIDRAGAKKQAQYAMQDKRAQDYVTYQDDPSGAQAARDAARAEREAQRAADKAALEADVPEEIDPGDVRARERRSGGRWVAY